MVFARTVPVSLTGIYTGGDRGILQALDVTSGDTVWEFDTVDSEDFWGNPDVNSGGGSWFPPSIDLASGRIFWGVANPAPFPGHGGVPERHEPSGAEPLHEHRRGARRPERRARLVPASDPARHLRS
jgi:hypothetical protein